MHDEVPVRAKMNLPAWLWGGHLRDFLSEAGLQSRKSADGFLHVQTDESYRGVQPGLVRVRTIKSANAPAHWRQLETISERVETTLPAELIAVLERRRIKAENSGDLLHIINHQRLLLHALPVTDLVEQSKYFLQHLQSVRFTEDPEEGPFPNPGLHLLEVDQQLVHRLKIASISLRIEQDDRLSKGDVAHILASNAAAETAFGSSAGLYSGVMMLDTYVAPLMAAGTPGIWGVAAIRSFGPLIFNLGTLISGTEGDAAEMLQLVSVPGADATVDFPRLSLAAGDAAIQWWGAGLNALFGVLSNPSTFTDTSGIYVPSKHLQSLLTLEQVFGRTASLLVAHRDTNARRALLFTVLDSMEGVRGADLLTMCTLGHAQKVLAGLERSMPRPAAEILLPAARRGVSALENMQGGFFIRRQLKSPTVDLRLPDGSTRCLSVESATARYLKLLRDATHGHGSDKRAARGMADALLAHHDGTVPHDIGLLGYLYLLDVLANPQRTRRLLHRGGR